MTDQGRARCFCVFDLTLRLRYSFVHRFSHFHNCLYCLYQVPGDCPIHVTIVFCCCCWKGHSFIVTISFAYPNANVRLRSTHARLAFKRFAPFHKYLSLSFISLCKLLNLTLFRFRFKCSRNSNQFMLRAERKRKYR